MKRVLCLYMGPRRPPGGCEIYRGNLPLYHLARHSRQWATGWEYFEDAVEQATRRGPGHWLDLLRSTDLLVFPRIVIPDAPEARQALAGLFQVARSLGVRIVYETDDDYTNEHRRVAEGDTLSAARWADAITVTTPYLGQIMRERTGRPVYVLPNCISPGDFRDGEAPVRRESARGQIVIALTGSASHEADWKVLAEVMPAVFREYPCAHLIVMGYQPPYLAGLSNTTYLNGVRYDHYAHILRGCDIILAPVDPLDRFNYGKSPIKAIEGMAAERKLSDGTPAGAAILATDHPVYRLAIEPGKTGQLVEHTPEGWLDGLRTLLSGHAHRQSLQRNGFRWVYRHHDISQEWPQWGRAYQRILDRPPRARPDLLSLHSGATS